MEGVFKMIYAFFYKSSIECRWIMKKFIVLLLLPTFLSGSEFSKLDDEQTKQSLQYRESLTKNVGDILDRSDRFFINYGLSIIKGHSDYVNNNLPFLLGFGYYLNEKLSLQLTIHRALRENNLMTNNLGFLSSWYFTDRLSQDKTTILNKVRPKINLGLYRPLEKSNTKIIYSTGCGFDFDVSDFFATGVSYDYLFSRNNRFSSSSSFSFYAMFIF